MALTGYIFFAICPFSHRSHTMPTTLIDHHHIYFYPNDPAMRATAYQLRETAIKLFPFAKWDESPFHDEPVGPHTLPMFNIDVRDNVDYAAVEYMEQEIRKRNA